MSRQITSGSTCLTWSSWGPTSLGTDGGADNGTRELHLGTAGNSPDTGASPAFKASRSHSLRDPQKPPNSLNLISTTPISQSCYKEKRASVYEVTGNIKEAKKKVIFSLSSHLLPSYNLICKMGANRPSHNPEGKPGPQELESVKSQKREVTVT